MNAAHWLMTQFGVDQSLVGDLTEQHHAGRSVLWLWRQAFAAIGAVLMAVIGRHYWLASRAVVIGWVIHAAVAQSRRPVMQLMSGWSWKVDLWLTDTLAIYIPISFMLVEAVSALVIGWTLARLHRPFSFPMVCLFVMSLLLFDLGGFVNSFRSLAAAHALNVVFPIVIVPLLVFSGACFHVGNQADERGEAT